MHGLLDRSIAIIMMRISEEAQKVEPACGERGRCDRHAIHCRVGLASSVRCGELHRTCYSSNIPSYHLDFQV